MSSVPRAEALASSLDDLLRQSEEIEAAAVISADGLPMASALPSNIEEDRLGAMAAAMLSLGERASENLGKGRLQQVFVEGSNGYVFLMSAGDAVLCAITSRNAKVGLVLYEMQRAASEIAAILEITPRPQVAPLTMPPVARPVQPGGQTIGQPQVGGQAQPAPQASPRATAPAPHPFGTTTPPPGPNAMGETSQS